MCKFIYEPTEKKEIKIVSQNRSYFMTSETYCNTKPHHGLFVTRIPEKDYIFHVLLSSLDETILMQGCDYQLAHHHFPETYYPDGNIYIDHHEFDAVLTTFYSMGPLTLKKEILLAENKTALFIKYTLLESTGLAKIRLSPFLAFRSIFALTAQNIFANTTVEKFDTGVSSKMYEDLPALFMQISKEHNFVFASNWYNNFEYNQDFVNMHEDLFTPGHFELSLNKGEAFIFTASLDKILDFKRINDLFDFNNNKKMVVHEKEKRLTKKLVHQYAS